ncbi:MAG: LysE family transporter [Chloroflexota bacterium]
MSNLLALFVTSLIVGFSGALMPGPLVTAAIAGSAREGFWVGPALTLGHAIAEAVIVLALAFGLGKLFRNRWMAGAIGFLGGLFLLWMGYDIAQSAWRGSVTLALTPSGSASRSAWGPVATGVLVSIANPYWVLWWATVGANYVLLGLKRGSLGLGAVYAGHILSDASWLTLVAFVVASGRAFLSDTIYQGILLLCSLFLVALSLYFIRSGANFLRGKVAVNSR